ncbi:MAG: NAD(P)H-hydrate dehydratase [Ignavibacteriota bacterium]|nr:NAD(P)H-hydrate dehydratase [Ignavibacteriota bacterium]
MKNVFFNTDVLAAEKKLMEKYSIPSIVLMENAGMKSAEIIWDCFIKENCSRIVILAGKGNNAGDGYVIARHLHSKNLSDDVYAPIHIFQCYPLTDLKGDALINFNIVKELFRSDYFEIFDDATKLIDITEIDNEKILFVDAVFGIGFKGILDEKIKNIFSDITQYVDNKFVIAIDTPSGLDDYTYADDCLKADLTITMGVRKFNTLFYSGKEVSGRTEVVDIGISTTKFDDYNDKEIYLTELYDTFFDEIHRGVNSHKYNNGKLFVLAGSEGFSGAAYLSAQSALRTGCGAVVLGIPEGLNSIMEAKTTEVITLPLRSEKYLTNDSYDKINDKMEWSDAVLVGPGIGRESNTMSFVRNLVKKYDKNYVIDADGIYAFKGHLDCLKKETRSVVLTPHFGEFANLLDITSEELKKDFYNISKEFALNYNVILVLKNSPTVVTNGNGFYINSCGHENLATIGSGDVLSGIIASLLGQSGDVFNSSISGVFLHSFCGDKLYDKLGNSGTIAGDLIKLIPEAKNEIIKIIRQNNK